MQRTPFSARLYSGALIGLAMAFSFASLIAMAFKHAEVSIGENRTLTQLPGWPRTVAQWDSFPERFDAYFNDNFGLRKLLLRLNSNFTTVMLGRSPSDKVVFGKDDWLFYAGDNSIELYRNQRPFSALQLANTEAALALRMRPLQAANRSYLFVVVPDKHTIYPEMMPTYMRVLAGPGGCRRCRRCDRCSRRYRHRTVRSGLPGQLRHAQLRRAQRLRLSSRDDVPG